MATEHLVLGMDVGGTATRALVIDLAGCIRGRGSAGGGNPVSHAPDRALVSLRSALLDALRGVDPGRVHTAVVGFAGGNLLRDPVVAAPFESMWRELGLRCPLRRVGDVGVAFAAGTAERHGTVLIAGTGAVAAHVQDRVPAVSTDGFGWLLGDLGSGFWLGREAVRAALLDLDARGAETQLTDLVIVQMLGAKKAAAPRRIIEDLITAAHAQPPVALSRLAPLVSRAADAGDEVASALVGTAVEHLVADVRAIRPPGSVMPLVLAGAVTAATTALGRLLQSRLEAEWPGTLRYAGDGAAAAAWLAASRLPDVDDEAAVRLHHRVMGRSGPGPDRPGAATAPSRRG